MTREELINKVSTDPYFSLGFAVDNNLFGVIQALQYAGITGGTSRAFAYEALKGLYESGKSQDVIKILSNVLYMNNVDNYTSGLGDFFLRTSPPESYPTTDPNERLNWNGVLSALGTGLTTYAAVTSATTSVDTNTAVLLAAEQERLKKEQEAKDKQQKTYLIIGISVVVVIVGIVLFATGRNKEKK